MRERYSIYEDGYIVNDYSSSYSTSKHERVIAPIERGNTIKNPTYDITLSELQANKCDIDRDINSYNEQLKPYQKLIDMREICMSRRRQLNKEIELLKPTLVEQIPGVVIPMTLIQLLQKLNYTIIVPPDCVLTHADIYGHNRVTIENKDGSRLCDTSRSSWLNRDSIMRIVKLNDTTYTIENSIVHSQGVSPIMGQIPLNARLFTLLGVLEVTVNDNFDDSKYIEATAVYLDGSLIRIGNPREIPKDYSVFAGATINLAKLYDTKTIRDNITKHIMTKILKQG